MLHRSTSLLAKARLKAMETAGIPVSAVLTEVGHHYRNLPAQERTPANWEAAFWAATEKISADPDIGARLGRLLPPLRGHVVEYFYSSSRTFGGALLRTLAYQKLVGEGLDVHLVMTADDCYLVDQSGMQYPRHLVECFVGGAIRFLHDISEGAFQPTAIHFTHRTGATPAEYGLLYGCPVKLGCAETRVYFNHASLGHEAWHADPSMQDMHERMAEQRLEDIDRLALVDAVTRAISHALETGDFGIDTIAARLGFSRRRLQMELAALDTSYNRILDDYRLQLTSQLLESTDEKMETITELCGFSDISAFYRAFRRWTGMTPAAWRQRSRDAAAAARGAVSAPSAARNLPAAP